MTFNISPSKKRFFKFAIVGFSGTVVDFGIFNLISSLFNLPTIPSSVVSFIAAVLNNFYWNRHWTYPESKEFSFSDQFGKFGIVSLAGLLIRTPIFSIIEGPMIEISRKSLTFLPFSAEVSGHNISLAIVIVIVLFWNYFVNKFWTYKGISER